MKTIVLSACACIAVALLCFGFLEWNSGTITYDPVQVVKLTACQYREGPNGKLLLATEITYQSLATGRVYPPTLCAADPFHQDVGDESALIGSTLPGYASPPVGILTLIRTIGVLALAIGLWIIIRILKALRKTNVIKE